jgi:hypothetical protein
VIIIFIIILVFIALFSCVRVIKSIYGITDNWLALQLLAAPWLGINPVKITIEEGKIINSGLESDWVEKITGPFLLDIRDESLAYIETLTGTNQELRKGKHSIRPFSILRVVLPLANMKDEIKEIRAITLDGIHISVRDIRFGFSLISDQELSGKRIPPPEQRTYEQALENMIYRYPIDVRSEQGYISLQSLSMAVQAMVIDEIEKYINKQPLDMLAAPRYPDMEARLEIEARFDSDEVIERFRKIGIKLIWMDIGYFEYGTQVEEQWLNTWKAGLEGHASVTQAYGEARYLATQEIGRAEAQVELLSSIIQALEEVDLPDDPDQNIRNVVLLKTAQMLESMTSAYQEDRVEKSQHPALKKGQSGEKKP